MKLLILVLASLSVIHVQPAAAELGSAAVAAPAVAPLANSAPAMATGTRANSKPAPAAALGSAAVAAPLANSAPAPAPAPLTNPAPTLPRIVITPRVQNSARPLFVPALPALAPDAQPAQIAAEQATPIVNWDAPPTANFEDVMGDDGIDDKTAHYFATLLQQNAKRTGVPGDVLFASMRQESDFKPFGVRLDYGNYSCGVQQANISGFCQAVQPSKKLKKAFGWPAGLNCDDLSDKNAQILAPFLAAIEKSRTLPDLGTEAADFSKLDKDAMIAQMPGATLKQKTAYAQAAFAFGENCTNGQVGVFSMASSLKEIYRDYIPKQLKAAHPHTAWIVADAIYNMGPVLIAILQKYGGPHIWQTLTPQKVIDIEGAIWMHRPADATNTTTFTIVDSDKETQHPKYFQACVNQRHITKIIHGFLPPEDADAIHWVTEDCGDIGTPAPAPQPSVQPAPAQK